MKSQLVKHQVKTFTKEISVASPRGSKIPRYIKVSVRHDDQCGNGHNTFSITGEISYPGASDCLTCGCIHDEISKHFPNLRPYLKWHGCTTDGPVHYIANTLYHAGDRDYNGLRKGEKRQIINGRTHKPCWILEPDTDLEKYVDAYDCPKETATLRYVPLCQEGVGKERDFGAARACAIWPEATDEQLSLEPRELAQLLHKRLPQLLEDFAQAVTELGLTY